MSSEPRPRAALPGAIGALRWVLLALLIAAAAAALLGLPRAFQAEGTSALRLVPVALLVLFVGGYAAYRFTLVRAGRYPAGKALVRVGLMVLLLGVVANIALERAPPLPAGPGLELSGPLRSPDPALRALAAEVVRSRPRPEGLRHAALLAALAEDQVPEVRREARASLGVLVDGDGGEGAGASARWLELLKARGLLSKP